MRMRFALVVLSLVSSGCLSATSALDTWDEPPGPRLKRGGPIGNAGVFLPPHGENTPLPPPPRKSVGNDSVPATDEAGRPVDVAVAAVRETMWSHGGEPRHRYACGGAVLAVVPGAEDPRGHEDAYRYLHSTRVVGPDNTTWVTDVYARLGDNGPRGRVWVGNVGGGEAFRSDDGSAGGCAPASHGNLTYNVMLHIDAVEEVEVFYAPVARFGVAERSYVEPAPA